MKTIDACRSCWSTELASVLNLGEQYLSDFRADDSRPPRYPLDLLICRSCSLVQLRHTAPRDELYHERYSFRSGVSEVIRADLHAVVETAIKEYMSFDHVDHVLPRTWLDIASNDGTLLSYVPDGIKRCGVDPLAQFAAEARQHGTIQVGYFDPDLVRAAWPKPFDVITSVSMFYDVDDPNAFVAGVKAVLAPQGVWVIQQNYALDMLRGTVFDNICHEHVTYFSLTSLSALLRRHGLEVVDVAMSPVNGGCIRTTVAREGVYRPTTNVREQHGIEIAFGVGQPDFWAEFADDTRIKISNLREFVTSAVDDGMSVVIYGASTRGATIWQAADLGADHFQYAVERQSAKVGRWMSAVGIPIFSEEDFRADRPDYAVVGPWFFREAIDRREEEYLKAGGRLVYPLPRLKVATA